MQLRAILREGSVSDSIVKRSIAKLLRSAWASVKFIIDPRFRSEKITAWRFAGQYHQRSTFTARNRYPLLFGECRNYFSGKPAPRILSFGCSTGEEVFTLGEYMPGASITGVDINQWCLRQCRESDQTHRYIFLHRQSADFAAAGNFDAVFCLAVFQRTENRTHPNASNYTFDRFEQELTLLDAKLNPGGLLIIDNTDFSFNDTVLRDGYHPHVFEGNQCIVRRPLFNRNNQKVADEQLATRIFVKQ